MVSERPIAPATPPSGATNRQRPAAPFGPIPDRAIRTSPAGRDWLVSIAAFVLYAVESVLRQHSSRRSVDITIFQQAIANYAQGRAPNVLVKSQEPFNILGDHFSPIMMVLAPFYRIWPSVLTLLIAQALLLAVGVHVVTRVAVRRLGWPRLLPRHLLRAVLGDFEGRSTSTSTRPASRLPSWRWPWRR